MFCICIDPYDYKVNKIDDGELKASIKLGENGSYMIHLSGEFNYEYIVDFKFPISYCPFCGGKLSKEESE